MRLTVLHAATINNDGQGTTLCGLKWNGPLACVDWMFNSLKRGPYVTPCLTCQEAVDKKATVNA